MPRLASLFAALVCVGATVVFLLPPPAGVTVTTMHAAALLVFTVGLWASGTLPEHITGFLFFLLAMLLAVAPPQIVFSGFASATLWLVLGGLILAQAVHRTGLAQRIAGALFDRYTRSYRQLIAAIVIVSIALAFFMPATVGRVLLLIPILTAVAQRAGFEHGSTGYNGICLAAIMTTYQCGTSILPANAPNLVLAGTAETLYGVQLIYAEYLWVQFPVMGILKGLAIIAFVCWLFRAEIRPLAVPHEAPPLTPEQQRMAVILIVALALWATDFLHGIKAGWIGLAAATACFMPRIGVVPFSAFNSVNFGPYFYVGATLGLGLMVQKSGLSEALGAALEGALPLTAGADFGNFVTMSLLATFAGLFTTNPSQPAVLAPLAEHFAQVTGWPLKATLMTMSVGFSSMIMPYQVPPVVVGMHVAGISLGTMLRLSLPLVAFSVAVLLPLDYLWWRLIGYVG
jgi:anion transporter